MKRIILISTAIAVVAIAAVIMFFVLSSNGTDTVAQNITVGAPAPNYGFLAANGSAVSLSSYRGHITVLWLVATWCPSCAQGNEALNQNYQFFKQHGIKIVELELYRDLGYRGPSIASFVNSYAPAAYGNGTIIPALAGYNMTEAYDPKGYLDIYYPLSSDGNVIYISGSPASTLNQLEQAINVSE